MNFYGVFFNINLIKLFSIVVLWFVCVFCDDVIPATITRNDHGLMNITRKLDSNFSMNKTFLQQNVGGDVKMFVDRRRRQLIGGGRPRRLNLLRSTNRNSINYKSIIKFRYYKNGEKTYESSIIDDDTMANSRCSSNEKFGFILHGWKQSCENDWVLKLIERLTYHRGGCIVCIDYSFFAEMSYMRLYRSFRIINNIISEKLLDLINQGMDPSDGFMFGFSYGGQLATSIGKTLSPLYVFKNIDTCDMAGPGFDLLRSVDHRESAEHVQCLHSSRDKGTRIYACHQNVRLGNCGFSQPAIMTQSYYSSHGLCPQIYINAFDYPFYAMKEKPKWCVSQNPAINVPRRFTIGYNEYPNSAVSGDIFVPTGPNFPYNLSEKELKILES